MLKYFAEVILLVIICSIPYLVSRLRLHSSASKKAMYDSARYTTVMRKDRV
jgi:hypothetical protein